jgi:hypothetical protein
MPTMTKHPFVYFLAIAAVAASSVALAGAGQTSAGVTTSTGTVDPTAASQNVQSQSSNFVQENQAQNGMPISSVVGTATTKTGTAQGGNPSNATGKPGDPNNPNDPKAAGAQAVVPVVPAAPPPDYVSNVKKVTRDPATTDVLVADNATQDGTKSPTSPTSAATNPATAANVIGAPGAQRQVAAATPRVPRAAETAKVNTADRTPQQTAPVSGSGSVPDSFAFYIGIIIAGALLAFAAATFFRSDKGAAK